MRPITARRLGAVLTTALLGLALAVPASAQAAPSNTYVALGDSYASGDGGGSYLRDGTSCYRSLKGYPGLLATANGLSLNLQACSGASIADVQTRQLGTLTANTGYVTVTVSGNDVGFSSTLTTCLGTNTTACLNAITVAEGKIASEIPGKLDTLFAAVKTKAPNATIVATGYPRLFNGRDCSLLTSFTSTEMTRLNAGADKLADAIGSAAGRAGIGYADVRSPFVTHAVCDSASWINNVKIFSQYESFHPNASGYSQGYAPTVKTVLQPAASGTSSKVTTGGTTSSNPNRGTVTTG